MKQMILLLHFTFISLLSIRSQNLTKDAAFNSDAILKKEKSELEISDPANNLCWMKYDFSSFKFRFLHNWTESFTWAKEINNLKYAGHSDWRVPTIKEYRTINRNQADRYNYKVKFVEIDSISIWGNGPYSFWSSGTPSKYTASYISFIDGFATSGIREKNYSNPYSSWKGVELGMSVRLVRSIR